MLSVFCTNKTTKQKAWRSFFALRNDGNMGKRKKKKEILRISLLNILNNTRKALPLSPQQSNQVLMASGKKYA